MPQKERTMKCTCGVGDVFYSHLHEKGCPVADDPEMKAPEDPKDKQIRCLDEQLAPLKEFVQLLQQLRAEEDSCVTIFSDNPDFNDQPNCLIEVYASWTNWQEMPFRADTVLECLRLAARAKDTAAKVSG
jgi:hypothetical protein